MQEFITDPVVCPVCRYRMDRAAILVAELPSPPSPGDATLCIDCGVFCIFDENLQLRLPTPPELSAFEKEDFWPKVVWAQRLIRAIRQARN